MYARFLEEAAGIVALPSLRKAAKEYTSCAEAWRELNLKLGSLKEAGASELDAARGSTRRLVNPRMRDALAYMQKAWK